MLVDFLSYFPNFLQNMILPKINKPLNPRFSCGPTSKPYGWSLKNINEKYLGRYHRSNDVKEFIREQINRIKKILNIPKSFKIFLMPGSCTGAVEAVIWNFFGKREVTTLIYDYWGLEWYNDLKKLDFKVDARISLDGTIPKVDNIPLENDLFFVWTGTSTGISFNNLEFLNPKHQGLVVSDITSAAFIYEIPWEKIDVSVFSWQKALGSESQHGIVVMSPKAVQRLESLKIRPIPKIFDFMKNNFVINTPSLLTISDLAQCLDFFENIGGLKGSLKKCIENKNVFDKWEQENMYIKYFVREKKYQAISPVYLIFKKEIPYLKIFNFLTFNKIAFDIQNYRKAKPGIRVWTGPTIKKNDLIALINWLDWCFNKFE